jgi:O-antigen/teichoic acid export membrane protein
MARQSLGGLAAKLFRVGCGFLFAVAAARLLGPRGYGVVAVAISMATVIATVALLGTNELAIREVANFSARKSWSELRRFARWSARTVITVSFVAGSLMAASSLLPGPYGSALLLGSFAVPLSALHHLLRGLIQGTGRVVASQLPMDVFRWIITLVLIACLIVGASTITSSTVILVVVIGLATSLVISGAMFIGYLRKLPAATRSADRPRWLLQSLPFLAVALFGMIGSEVGTLLLGWLSGPREAGLYQPIAKLAPLMLLANDAIEAALAPKIVHSSHDEDGHSLQRRMTRSALASTLATGAIVAAIVIASPYILRAFGPEFTQYRSLLVWIGAAQIVNAATGAAPLLLAMTGDMKRRIRAQATTTVVELGLAVALIPSWGAVGAVAALIGSILTWSLLHWWLALRATGIDTSVISALRSTRRKAVG